MLKQAKKIDSATVMAASKRASNFWAAIDGNKLGEVARQEKESDMVGPLKQRHVRLA